MTFGFPSSNASDLTLHYSEPATGWLEALPIGNGRLGAMVFGGVVEEHLQLNEETIWGGPPLPQNNPNGRKYIDEARSLLFAGQYAEAEKILNDDLLGSYSGDDPRSYQPLGDVKLAFGERGKPIEYVRELDIDSAVTTTTYKFVDVKFRHEALVSAVDQVIAFHISSSTAGRISFTATLDRSECASAVAFGNDCLFLSGQASQGGKHEGVKFDAVLKVVIDGGKVTSEGDRIVVAAANSATLLVACQTDYNRETPFSPLTLDRKAVALATVNRAGSKPWQNLKADSVADYQSLFRRVSIDLGTNSQVQGKTTVERLLAVQEGTFDPGLEALYYQFGRYLLISSSRPGTLAANLQGIWNYHMKAPWNSDYHPNINVQMNYWLAEPTNLSECHEPFFWLIEHMVEPGKETATTLGCNGTASGHATDVWHWTALMGQPVWASWPHGIGWCSQHFMEHYRFTGDKEFLKNRALPVIEESARFYLDWLVIHPDTGKLVSGPDTSPENRFFAPDGSRIAVSMGPSMSQEIIWDVFTNLLEATTELGISNDLTKAVSAALDKLAMPKIGSDGRIMEWAEEFEEPEPHHRHCSHLYGLHPGHQFSLSKSPEMVEAARITLLTRGDESTGWSKAWKIAFWSRLHDGDHCHELIKLQLTHVSENAAMNYSQGGGTYANLFDAHPPFQIDGNFGVTAAMTEMLLQSHDGAIDILPALPSAWTKGRITGLCARGGWTVDIAWSDGKLTQARLMPDRDQSAKVRYDGKMIVVRGVTGTALELSSGSF